MGTIDNMKKTAIDIIRQINLEVENRLLPVEVMIRDIQMMNFKVRSLIGDISHLETVHRDFIESLWKIGRIDEIVNDTMDDLDDDEQDALLEYFGKMETDIQNKIRQSLAIRKSQNKSDKLLKLEIFKDTPFSRTVH